MINPRIVVASLAATLALAACSETTTPASSGSSAKTSSSGGAAASATPTPAGLAPDAYKSALDTAGKPVGGALAAIGKAGTFKSLDQRLEKAQQAVDKATQQLGGLQAPPEIGQKHADYLDALRRMNDELETLRDGISEQSLCTSTAVLARLGKSDEFGELKKAGAALADGGGYSGGKIGLKPPKEQNRRLGNGTVFSSRIRGGRGTLTVKNGGSQDGVVTLLKGKQKAVSLYIRKKSSARLSNIKDGSYRVYFTTGTDFDRKKRTFTRSCAFERFDDNLKFSTVYTATQIRWQTWTLTLNKVKGGNAPSRSVDPDTFPA
ncbi:hypothetical protein Pth03_72200 [Planotetraspora thailandica]|uniref:Uncharacterized protein n=1 Tax=Planotetraspora thailandica TaxID=487172 RepID=A0A8J4DEC1_9ACTN|nr:hypothetical protein [Planotetraspora thailandica]GII58831.1 hypothetical protein Pth03_72200 [Planotetraspora thailandica]